jgi:hypothetical protein
VFEELVPVTYTSLGGAAAAIAFVQEQLPRHKPDDTSSAWIRLDDVASCETKRRRPVSAVGSRQRHGFALLALRKVRRCPDGTSATDSGCSRSSTRSEPLSGAERSHVGKESAPAVALPSSARNAVGASSRGDGAAFHGRRQQDSTVHVCCAGCRDRITILPEGADPAD